MNKITPLLIFMVIFVLSACSTTTSTSQAVTPATAPEAVTPPAEQANTLTSTNTGIATNKPTNTFTANTNSTVGGHLTKSMDSVDKVKMSRALDKAIGKTTEWKNEATGMRYAITPTKKVTVGDNHFCRQYTMTATRGDNNQELNETACIGPDGEWHPE